MCFRSFNPSVTILCMRMNYLLTSCHARRKFFVPKLQYFLSFNVYLSITQAKQTINLLLLNNFCPVIYQVEKESDELMYTVWSLVMVRNQLPTQVVNT